MTGKNSVVGVDLGGTNIRAGRVKEGTIEKIIEVLTPDNPQTAQETIDK